MTEIPRTPSHLEQPYYKNLLMAQFDWPHLYFGGEEKPTLACGLHHASPWPTQHNECILVGSKLLSSIGFLHIWALCT